MTEGLNCKSIQRALWDFAARVPGEADREIVAAHLEECRECRLHRVEMRSLRSGLRNLPRKAISPLLATRLQVIASRERSRNFLRRNIVARIKELRSRAGLLVDNLLKPLAVPVAGGILASVLCFGVIVDTLQLQYRPDWPNDIPVGLFTQVTLDDVSPFGCAGKDVIVQLTVDAEGRVIDYVVPRGVASAAELQEIGNLVLYSTFTPATSFGQRVAATFLVSINHVNVRG